MTGADLIRAAHEVLARIDALDEAADAEALHAAVDILGEDIEGKIAAYIAVIEAAEARATHLTAEAARCSAAAGRERDRAGWLRDRMPMLIETMRELRGGKPGSMAVGSRKVWTASTASVRIVDEGRIPSVYMVTTVPSPITRPDRQAIAATLKAGAEVPGCALDVREGARWR